jgi:hypothetical protein
LRNPPAALLPILGWIGIGFTTGDSSERCFSLWGHDVLLDWFLYPGGRLIKCRYVNRSDILIWRRVARLGIACESVSTGSEAPAV